MAAPKIWEQKRLTKEKKLDHMQPNQLEEDVGGQRQTRILGEELTKTSSCGTFLNRRSTSKLIVSDETGEKMARRGRHLASLDARGPSSDLIKSKWISKMLSHFHKISIVHDAFFPAISERYLSYKYVRCRFRLFIPAFVKSLATPTKKAWYPGGIIHTLVKLPGKDPLCWFVHLHGANL